MSARNPVQFGRRGVRWTFALSLCVTVVVRVTTAQSPPPEGTADSASRDEQVEWPPEVDPEAAGAVFGEILIRPGNVFDTDDERENRRLFRLVNRLHRVTRPRVIRRLLLFDTGDPYSERLLEESERILRSSRYLYEARIRPVGYHDDAVDVEVRTRDEWTLRGGVGYGRSGGKNTLRVGLEDVNLLGTGKNVGLRRTDSVDRTTFLYRYLDPNLLGSRVRLGLSYSDNSDGFERQAELGQPFFALDSRWSAGGSALASDRVDTLYALGHVVDEFRHEQETVDVTAGFSHGLVRGRALRWGAGFAYEEHRFEAVPGTVGTLPADRVLAYPYVRFEWIDDGFEKARNLDRIEYTEDVNIGSALEARLGWSSPSFGGDRGRAIFRARFRTLRHTRRVSVIGVAAHVSGRWDRSVENFEAGTELRCYARERGRGMLFFSLRLDAAHALDRERQLLLGGDNGLRGYPLRYAEGDRSYLLTLEQRWYAKWHVLQLLRVGAAVFADAGRAWFSGDAAQPDLGQLEDVGLGLRLSSSRTSSDSVFHVDLAFPLDGGDEIEGVQFLVKSRTRF